MFVIRTLSHPSGDENKEELIREIKVANTAKRTMLGAHIYEVKKPVIGQPVLYHDRTEGDLVLALKAIRLVQDNSRKFPPEEEDDDI